jgi:endogenous inhibitor of DNA gyrase (YacG/DUF329 family)
MDRMDRMPAPDASNSKACPICGKPAADKYRPFCGHRCADVDLNRWLSDAYVLPAKADADDEAGPPELPDEEG